MCPDLYLDNLGGLVQCKGSDGIVIGRRADYPERSVGELLLYVNKSKSA